MLWNSNLSMRNKIQQLNKDESCFENYNSNICKL